MNPDLLAETFRRSDQLLAAWAVHAVVAVAVLALVLAAPAVRADRRARRVLAAAFAFLALANLEGMLWILKQWDAVAAVLHRGADFAGPGREADAAIRALADVTAAPPALWVVPFHLALDGFVLWATLWPVRRPRDRESVAGLP